MKLLLDTCCIVWAISSPETLSTRATELLQREDTQAFVSPLSAAELACAVQRGRVTLVEHWKTWFRRYVEANDWAIEPIDLAIAEEAYCLPDQFHSDPVDRLLVATARLRGMTILTADKRILAYPHVVAAW